MVKLKDLEQEIANIKERNKLVEADKAWETSFSRKILIAVITYFVIVLFFSAANLQKPFINAIVPTIAFTLSTLSLPFFRKLWLRYVYKTFLT